MRCKPSQAIQSDQKVKEKRSGKRWWRPAEMVATRRRRRPGGGWGFLTPGSSLVVRLGLGWIGLGYIGYGFMPATRDIYRRKPRSWLESRIHIACGAHPKYSFVDFFVDEVFWGCLVSVSLPFFFFFFFSPSFKRFHERVKDCILLLANFNILICIFLKLYWIFYAYKSKTINILF